jgi:hypothetical protein
MYTEGDDELQEKLAMKIRDDLMSIESKTKKKSKSGVRTHRVMVAKVKTK